MYNHCTSNAIGVVRVVDFGASFISVLASRTRFCSDHPVFRKCISILPSCLVLPSTSIVDRLWAGWLWDSCENSVKLLSKLLGQQEAIDFTPNWGWLWAERPPELVWRFCTFFACFSQFLFYRNPTSNCSEQLDCGKSGDQHGGAHAHNRATA